MPGAVGVIRLPILSRDGATRQIRVREYEGPSRARDSVRRRPGPRPSGAPARFAYTEAVKAAKSAWLALGGLHPFAVWSLSVPGGHESQVIPHGCCGAFHPSYLPDGRRIAYVTYRHSDDGDVYVAQADGRLPTRVTCQSGWTMPEWSPGGTQLVLQRAIGPHALWRIDVPAPGERCSSRPIRMTEDTIQGNEPTWTVVRRAPGSLPRFDR